MADGWPPSRASPRPLAIVFSGLTLPLVRRPCEPRFHSPAAYFSSTLPSDLRWWSGQDERIVRYDRSPTTHAGGSPDPPLLNNNHSTLPARCLRVRSAFR